MSVPKWMALALTGLLVAGVVLTAGCTGSQIETPAQIIKNITPQEAFTLIENNQSNPDFVILDVRTAEEVANGYIENAINLDYCSESFREELDKLDKTKTYLVYCRSGNRSGKTLDVMAELNFSEVYNMLGGFVDWEAQGLPTVR